ncbi:MAG: hypothetical protein JXX28_03635 [Deltaproteobacteria bacterium]|nr:hypothetical protein [Deltaproteobacteria bacterium]
MIGLLFWSALLGCEGARPAYVSQEEFLQREMEVSCSYAEACWEEGEYSFDSIEQCVARLVEDNRPEYWPCYSGTHAAEALEVMEGWSCEEGIPMPEVYDWVYVRWAYSADEPCGPGGR